MILLSDYTQRSIKPEPQVKPFIASIILIKFKEDKMKLLLLCVLALVDFSVGYSRNDEMEWELFKIQYSKSYHSEDEEKLRKEIFMGHLVFIREHFNKYDKGEYSFLVGINEFADLANEEFVKLMTGYRIPEDNELKGENFEFDELIELPGTVNWVERGAVTPVKHQKYCASSWAFSATGSLESHDRINHELIPWVVSLSEQNLIDCSRDYGNEGCHHGSITKAFSYVQKNQGIDSDTVYYYKARDDEVCRYNPNNIGATLSGWVDLPEGDEIALQKAVAFKGPVSVAIDASGLHFQLYKGGVLSSVIPRSNYDLNHAVLVVGYGTFPDGADYWLVKNSWGADWGMKGYMFLPRNENNMYGIASRASFPLM